MLKWIDDAFQRAREAQKTLYFSAVDVLRPVSIKPDYEDGHELTFDTIYTQIPCKFSQRSVPVPNQTDSVHKIDTDYTILCDPDYVFIPGDRFRIYNEGRIYEMFYGGEPAVFRTHQEIRITKQDNYA